MGVLDEIKRFITYVVCILLVIAIFKVAFCFKNYTKANILYATKADICACTDIGEKLSTDIYNYVQCKGIERVSDLEGHVKGIGDKRIRELEEVFK